MPDNQLDIAVVCGSFRRASYNAALARSLPGLAPAGLNLKSAPPIDKFPLYNADIQNTSGFPAEVTAFADAIRAVDGVIIVSPEYNWSIPAGIKNAIDWTSRFKDEPLKGKPVALQSCAGGLLGGARMQYHLRQAMIFLNAYTFNTPEIFVGMAQTKFDETTMEFKDEAGIKFITQQLAAFEGFIRKLTGK